MTGTKRGDVQLESHILFSPPPPLPTKKILFLRRYYFVVSLSAAHPPEASADQTRQLAGVFIHRKACRVRQDRVCCCFVNRR